MNQCGKVILIGLLLCGLMGCVANHPIRYKMSDITPSPVTQLKDVTLSIESFADNRRSVPENELVFFACRDTSKRGTRICINSEDHYKKEPVAKQITALIAAHLKQRGAFKDVLVDSEASADFQLQGAIRQFYGQQNYSYAKAAGAQLGLVGVLSTIWIKSHGIIKIEFTDLKLVDKDGTVVRTLEDISKTFEDQFPVDAYCWQIYWNTDRKLEEVIDSLADDIEKNISEIIADTLEERKTSNHNQ